MVCRAAVIIYDERQQKEIVIPCHRHADAFQILHDFGYRAREGYHEIAQGFLDEHDNFLTRIEAMAEAKRCNQLINPDAYGELYSEDVW